MPNKNLILRIDDRLIHGQVLVGWANQHPIKHFIVGNDEIAENDWEKDLLMMAVPPHQDAKILSLKATTEYINTHLDSPEMAMVLIKGPEDLKQMARNGLKLKEVNVGGIHFNEGRKEILSYLFLSDDEISLFRQLMAEGFTFTCQDVPTGHQFDLKSILEQKT